MKLKKILFALPVLFLLAGCNNSEHKEFSPTNSGEYAPVSIRDLSFFEIQDANVSLTVNQVHQLKPVFKPVLSHLPKVTYVSSNPESVYVSPSGQLVGKNPGFAIITANCQGFSSQTYVSVTNENSKATAIENLNNIYEEQRKSTFIKPDYLHFHEHSNNIVYKDGKVLNENEGFEEVIMSKSNAYIWINDTYDQRHGVTNGNSTYSSGMWLFYCTEELEVFICHEANGVRRWMSVIAPPGTDRWGAIGEIMGYIFSNFFTILENQYKTVGDAAHMKSEIIGYVDEGRADDSGNAYGIINDTYKNQTLDFDLQRIFGTPASGGSADIVLEDEFFYYENYCRYFNYNQSISYDWRGSSYLQSQRGWRSYDFEEKELYYPDLSKDNTEGWTQGKDIFEI